LAITRYSPGRIVAVTIGLAVAGAAFGGIAGVLVLGTISVLTPGFEAFGEPLLFAVAATLGALLGAGCAPLAGWLLLRRVPLGRAFRGLTLGTIAGGVLGWFVPLPVDKVNRSLIAGALGFLCAAIIMRIRQARPPSDPAPNQDGAA